MMFPVLQRKEKGAIISALHVNLLLIITLMGEGGIDGDMRNKRRERFLFRLKSSAEINE
jgi:hypothetical protein